MRLKRIVEKYNEIFEGFLDFQNSYIIGQTWRSLFVSVAMIIYSILCILSTIYWNAFSFAEFSHVIMMYILSLSLFSIFALLYIFMLKSNIFNCHKQKQAYILDIMVQVHMFLSWCWGGYVLYISIIEGRGYNYIIWAICVMVSVSITFVKPIKFLIMILVNLSFVYSIIRFSSTNKKEAGVVYNLVIFSILLITLMTTKYLNALSSFRKTKILDKVNEDRERFLINMTHEMRTPLTAVLGKNELIKQTADNDEIRSLSNDIHNTGKILLSIINDVMDISRIESGKMSIVPNEYKIADVAYEVVDMLHSDSEIKHIKLVTEFDDNIPSVLYGDEVRIRQILINLISNAIKYTRVGTITFKMSFHRISEKQGYLDIHVTDTGIGIKQEDLPKLAAAFYRLDENRNKYVQGTGLGLSITSNLLKMMGSQLQVASVYEEGSIFSFHLLQDIVNSTPFKIKDNLEKKVIEKPRAQFLLPEVNILIVDDNAVNRLVCCRLLSFYKINADQASSGQECLDYLQKKKYDMILLDHLMPDMDGIETLTKIKETMPELECITPIIALSANSFSDAKNVYVGYGFTDFLSKPIDPEKMEKMLINYLPKNYVKKTS